MSEVYRNKRTGSGKFSDLSEMKLISRNVFKYVISHLQIASCLSERGLNRLNEENAIWQIQFGAIWISCSAFTASGSIKSALGTVVIKTWGPRGSYGVRSARALYPIWKMGDSISTFLNVGAQTAADYNLHSEERNAWSLLQRNSMLRSREHSFKEGNESREL